jgi:predicted DNA-binding transcriptional regulator AlpA
MAGAERRVLSETELAHLWGIHPKTLQRWRSEGRGPKYLKLSKRVAYPMEFIRAYEHVALHVSTSERDCDRRATPNTLHATTTFRAQGGQA